VTKELSLLIGLETYNKTKAGYYRDYVGYEFEEGDFAFPNDYEGDFDIAHAFNISITPIQFGVKLTPLGKRSRLIPYVGAGGGLYFWTLRLQGDIIDFNDIWYYEDPDYGDVEIYSIWPTDAREENKITFGYHVFGGLMFPVGNRVTLDIEFKYNNAKGTFSDAFEGFERFDLSGMQISLGLNYWF
jgi:opacity protein-like surface antigen